MTKAQQLSSDKIFVIDFDSTLVQVEALDELASLSLKNSPQRDAVVAQIRDITRQGMEGQISIGDSLRERVALLQANRSHVEQLTKQLKKRISRSFLRNKAFLRKYSKNIYIMTSGFREYVIPVITDLGLREENVFANSFIFDSKGRVIGLDTSNILSQERGKVEQLKRLRPKGDVYVIGDGMTDYQMKESGLVKEFIAFTENVSRQIVIDSADRVAKSFDEVLYAKRLPMNVSYPKSKIKVLLLEGIHPLAVEMLRAEGFSVETRADALDESTLAKELADVSILGIRSKTRITPLALKNARKLLAVGAFCIGTEQIDLSACSQQGVIAFNAPYSNTRSVVELALGEIIMLMRRIFESSTALHTGKWIKSASGCFEIRGKKLGIVGYGNIGSQLSVLAEALGLDVYYYDIVERLALGNAKKCRSLEELLGLVDIVTLHVDGRSSNRNLMGEKQFAAMKPGAIFLNLSRGHIVEISALTKAIKDGRVAGAAVDVFPHEPHSNKEEFLSELRGLPNVILTPHIGGSTLEAQRNIGEYVAARMIEYINNGSSFSSVNFPVIQLPSLQKAHRFLHIHHNVPGILAEINGILAKGKINILGQYLKTNEHIGYVITDVDKKYNSKIIDDLKSVTDTIKFRVLY